jgi:hypothetical protein
MNRKMLINFVNLLYIIKQFIFNPTIFKFERFEFRGYYTKFEKIVKSFFKSKVNYF